MPKTKRNGRTRATRDRSAQPFTQMEAADVAQKAAARARQVIEKAMRMEMIQHTDRDRVMDHIDPDLDELERTIRDALAGIRRKF